MSKHQMVKLKIKQSVRKITASSQWGSSQCVGNLSDVNSNSCWGSSNISPPHWVRLEMLPGVIITDIAILVRPRGDNYIPRTIHVFGGDTLGGDMTQVATVDVTLDQLHPNNFTWVKLLDHVERPSPDGHWAYLVWEIRVMELHGSSKGCELYGLTFIGHYQWILHDSVVIMEKMWKRLKTEMEEINHRQTKLENTTVLNTCRMNAGSFAKLDSQRHSQDEKVSALCDVVIVRGEGEEPIKAHSNVLCTRAGRFMTLLETVRARDTDCAKFTVDDFYPLMDSACSNSVDSAQSHNDSSANSDNCSKKKVEYPISNDTLTEGPPAYSDIDNFSRRPPAYPGNDSDSDRAAAVQHVIDFCYNKEPPLTMQNVGNIYKVSDKIGVSDLKRACADLVITSINSQNWVEHYHTALGLNVGDLVEKVKEYAKDHPKDCLQCPDVVYLSLHSFYFIFHENVDDLENLQNLSAEDEIVLYEAIIQWLRSESLNEIVRGRREERLLNAGKLMSLVKFKYIAEEYLWDQIQNEPILAANPGVVKEMRKVLPRQRQDKSTKRKKEM